MKSNTVRIEIDKNPESGHPCNTDMLLELAGPIMDWRLLGYDGDNDFDEILLGMYNKFLEQHDAIAEACHVENIYIETDIVDAFDFIYVVYNAAEPNVCLAMISYDVDDSTFIHD